MVILVKRLYLFAVFLLLMGLLGYPLVQELRHVSEVKQSKSDFQKILDKQQSRGNPVRRSSRAWNDLPEALRKQLRDLGFFPASLSEGTMGFSLKKFNGERARLADYTGQWVLLNFWATWCPPCRMEMPSLDQLQQQHPETLNVLTINIEQTRDTIKRFRQNYGFTLPILLDSRGRVAEQYGLTGVPESWLITPAGQPLAKLNGPLEWHNPPASTTIEKLFETSPSNRNVKN